MLLVSAELRPSPIEGLGLYSLQDIQRGQAVWRFDPLFDIEFSDAQFAALPDAARDFLKRYGYRSVDNSVWTINLDLSRHMNHADAPTLYADGDSTYYAARDLPAGTELTCDYKQFALEGCIDAILELEVQSESSVSGAITSAYRSRAPK